MSKEENKLSKEAKNILQKTRNITRLKYVSQEK